MASVDTEIVVVGAGVNGLATAYELARTGRDVTVVEQFALGHDRGASHGAARIFRLSYPDPQWVRRAQEALADWRRLEAELGESLLRRTGSLDIGRHAPVNAAALAACGADAASLGVDEVHARFGVAVAPDEAAVLQPDAGVLAADRTMALLATAARAHGAEVLEHHRVAGVDVGTDRVVVRSDDGEVSARAVVVAAGAWARDVLAPLGVDLPVAVTRETVTYLAAERAAELPALVFSGAPDDGGSHEIGRYALANDADTLKVGVHLSGPEVDPDERGDPDPAGAERSLAWARARLPGRHVEHRADETCLYATTPDEGFVLERHGRVVVGSACSGHAFKFAPQTGARLAALAVEAAERA